MFAPQVVKATTKPLTGMLGSRSMSHAPPVMRDGSRADGFDPVRAGGHALDTAARRSMESRFGHDFGNVRVYADAPAARAADARNAAAFTIGSDIIFGAAAYAPQTATGRRLIAHELAHVVQQRQGAFTPRTAPPDALERDAEQAARAVTSGSGTVHVFETSGRQIARQERSAAVSAAPLPADVERSKEHQELLADVAAFKWPQAAELLNSYSAAGITSVFATFDVRQIESIHFGALANGRVGRDAQVAKLAFAAAPGLTTARDTLIARRISMQEFVDVINLSRSDFRDRHGFWRFGEVRDIALALPSSVWQHVLPLTDRTLYLQPSGRIATNADEKANQTAERIAEAQPPSATGTALLIGGKLAGASPETQRNLVKLGDNVSDIGLSVAPIAGGAVARSRATTPPAQPEPPSPKSTVPLQKVTGLPPGSPANDTLPPNVIPLRQPQPPQAPPIAVAAGQDFNPEEAATGRTATGDRTVAAASKGSGGTPPKPKQSGGALAPANAPPVSVAVSTPVGAAAQPRTNNIIAGLVTEAEFKKSMPSEPGRYLYEIVDARGNHLKWGTAANPVTRFNAYVTREGQVTAQMRVHRPHPLYQSLAAETHGIESELERGGGGQNIRTNTRTEMPGRDGAEWGDVLDTPRDPGPVLITIRRW